MSGVEFAFLLIGLGIVATLYASVGHGGASGYLAIMSLTSYGLMEAAWLKQHAWFLNLLVASLAFYHYRKAGFHNSKLTIPFIIASIPMAFLGGYLIIDGVIYDFLLSITLVWAAWRLFNSKSIDDEINTTIPSIPQALPWGAGIGLASGLIGVGGGIFLSPIVLLKKWAAPKTIAATSAIFIWVNSISGLMGATASGQLVLDLEILTAFATVVIVGGFIGSAYGAKFAPQSAIRKLLVLVLLIAAAKRIFGLSFLLIG
ncbi:MAG: sulfite exporter TauE/SafE family protein [Euryarchaeota archaeon]|nr:sulfite exporter TauE/SafE family protein [Euryarchaeota archaeon]